MKKSITNIFIFTVGAVIGSAVTWKYTKAKYEQIAKEEIESVKEVYSRRAQTEAEEKVEPIDDDSLATSIEEMNRYCDEIEKSGYATAVDNTKERRGRTVKHDEPYLIPPEEFDEIEGYTTVTLTYYNDGVLANMWDSPLDEDEIEELVGSDFMEHFGVYEDDTVYIRNDALKTDYEIQRDWSNYSEIMSGDSRQVNE